MACNDACLSRDKARSMAKWRNQRFSRPLDQRPDQARGHEAEGDAVSAVAVGREQARMTGHAARSMAGRLRSGRRRRTRHDRGRGRPAGPAHAGAPAEPSAFSGPSTSRRPGSSKSSSSPPKDDAAVRGRAAVAIILRRLPDERGAGPERLRHLWHRRDRPARGDTMQVVPDDIRHDIAGSEHDAIGLDDPASGERNGSRTAGAVEARPPRRGSISLRVARILPSSPWQRLSGSGLGRTGRDDGRRPIEAEGLAQRGVFDEICREVPARSRKAASSSSSSRGPLSPAAR